MPVVLRKDGFSIRVLLPPREHGPPHVHIHRAEGACVIELGTLAVRRVDRMRDSHVIAAVGIVADYEEALLTAWRSYHGEATD
jgi:hypothetical protein